MIGSTNTLVDKKGGYIIPQMSSSFKWVKNSNIPFSLDDGCAVVYRGELHALGESHYKYNGSSWEVASTVPYDMTRASAVVYGDEIHVMGRYPKGNSAYGMEHYKWDGTNWSKVSDLPYQFYDGTAVLHKNEIHIFISDKLLHYKWDSDEYDWVKVSNTPNMFSGSSAVSYHDELYVIGCASSNTSYSKFNEESLTWETYTMPFQSNHSCAVVYDNEIHLLGSAVTDYGTIHYAFDGTSWRSDSSIPYRFYRGAAVVYKNDIYILGSYDSSTSRYFYKSKHTKTYSMTLPFGASLYTNDLTSISYPTDGGTLLSNKFVADKLEYCDVKITINRIYPITVVKDRSILYMNNGYNSDGERRYYILKNMKVDGTKFDSDVLVSVSDVSFNVEY